MRGTLPSSSRQEPSPPSPRRRAGPSTTAIPPSFAYGAPPEVSNSSSANRTLINSRGKPNTSSKLVDPNPTEAPGLPSRDTSVRIANALAQAKGTTSIPSVSTLHSSSSTLIDPSQSTSSLPSYQRPPNSREQKQNDKLKPSDSFDNDRGKRGLSPVEALGERQRALSPYFLQLRESNGAGFQSMNVLLDFDAAGASKSIDESSNLESRDYDTEEREFAELQASAAAKAAKKHRKHMTYDNKAYKPSASENEESADDVSDGGTRRRKKKGLHAKASLDGQLPMVSAEKRRKGHGKTRKSVGSRKALEDHSGSGMEQLSRDPSPVRPPDSNRGNQSFEDEKSVVDLTHEEIDRLPSPTPAERAYGAYSDAPSRQVGIGATLGILVRGTVLGLRSILLLIASILRLLMDVFGSIYEITLTRPLSWLRNSQHYFSIRNLLLTTLLVGIALWIQRPETDDSPYIRRGGWLGSIIGHSPKAPYKASPALPENWEELSSQFGTMQAELASLSEQLSRMDNSAVTQSLQRQLQLIRGRADDSDVKLQNFMTEVRDVMSSVSKRLEKQASPPDGLSKIESTIERLHDWIRRVETSAEVTPQSIRDLEKKVAALQASESKGRSTKGPKEVTPAIAQYFERMLLRALKDRIGLADFAIYGGGGRIIPSLTSLTYELSVRKSWIPFVGGSSGPLARPPVTALIPDLNVGNCWPLRGSNGTLGVYLTRHIHISSFSIDHASKDVVYDITPAPKHIRVWGIVDGADNLAKLSAHREELSIRKEAGTLNEDEVEEMEEPRPPYAALPKTLEFLSLAKFEYDINAPDNVQTFQVPDRIKNLDIDFGVVLFDIRSNWGHSEYTCLYRVRVHGTEFDTETPRQA
ncbi:uncharacterized protein EI90DRAFT_2293952 [Cantharellus anzutake]|uniref:uncharacterized protein n=1 Tax=Cantharellus anzutake TaxID=1750568 RepID=UPI0019054D02|nr:uncharacterized protein EI90DRAFT_2293952 [Cantharellus anzutake]KAF8339851.1 hypothetical protein EI90DRAFT_2293952 [Cantharellus anzutake]